MAARRPAGSIRLVPDTAARARVTPAGAAPATASPAEAGLPGPAAVGDALAGGWGVAPEPANQAGFGAHSAPGAGSGGGSYASGTSAATALEPVVDWGLPAGTGGRAADDVVPLPAGVGC